MFTGIISSVGAIVSLTPGEGVLRAVIESDYDPAGVAIGASIAHDGCCLTVVETVGLKHGMRHSVDVAAESLDVTTLGAWKLGDKVNLERSLRAGDELGGHFVLGHVDGVGEVREVNADGEGWRIVIKPPYEIAHLIAPKGSIAVNGVSLTVNAVDEAGFGVLIIPHTWSATTLSALKAGDKVNLEADMMARYAARLIEARRNI